MYITEQFKEGLKKTKRDWDTAFQAGYLKGFRDGYEKSEKEK